MTTDDLARGRALEARADRGPWVTTMDGLHPVVAAAVWVPTNANLVCWLRNHAADLLDAAERAARLEALLRRCGPFLALYQCESMQEGDELTALEQEVDAALARPKGDSSVG